MASRAFASLLLANLIAVTGCIRYLSHYQPRQRGRQLVLVQDDNKPALQGEGGTTGVGWFGGGLVDRVEAVPAADEAARTYRRRNVWSTITGIPSGICVIGGGSYYLSELADHGEEYDPPLTWSFLMVGCVGGLLASQLLRLSAESYLYDAVNLYNDGVEPGDAAAPRAGVPFVDSAVLRMATRRSAVGRDGGRSNR